MKGSWMTISVVKSSSARGVGGSGGLERASVILLDSPVTCLMPQVNWLMNRSGALPARAKWRWSEPW